MKKIMQGMMLLLILFTSSSVLAAISESSLDKLMALSGLKKQATECPKMIEASLNQSRQQGAAISDKEFDAIQKAIKGAFVPSEMLVAIESEIKNNISESEAGSLLAWYESDLGKKITKAEEDASTPAAYQEMMIQAQTLFADKERLEFAQRIENLLQLTDFMLQLQQQAGLTVFTAISTAMNPAEPVNVEAFKINMSAQEQQTRANLKQFSILSLLYSYKDIESSGMKKYIEFLARYDARKFNTSAIKGIKIALNQSIDKMAKSLADVAKDFKNSSAQQQ